MEREKNNFLIYFLFGISLILIITIFYLFFYAVEKPIQVTEFDVEFRVVEEQKVGFDANGTALTFGKTYPGGSGSIRTVNITNNYDFPVGVKVLVTKNLAKFLAFNSSFFVEPGEQIEISLALQVPSTAEYGNYTGRVRFELYPKGN